jgi:hypothetical protein
LFSYILGCHATGRKLGLFFLLSKSLLESVAGAFLSVPDRMRTNSARPGRFQPIEQHRYRWRRVPGWRYEWDGRLGRYHLVTGRIRRRDQQLWKWRWQQWQWRLYEHTSVFRRKRLFVRR